MASLQYQAAPSAEIALAAATAKTVLQVAAPANQRVKLMAFGVYFDGVSTTAEPVQIELVRQTTAGTMTAITAATNELTKRDPSLAEAVQATAAKNATAEPTTTDIVEARECHPQQGLEVWYPIDREVLIQGGGRLGLRITAPAAVNCRPYMALEE